MTVRPIIFSAPMVRALLAGRKTQTRRIIKNVRRDNCITLRQSTPTKSGLCTHIIDAPKHKRTLPVKVGVGDRLWVREAFCWGSEGEAGAKDFPIFRANYDGEADKILAPWKPSIHMPRWASRITLTVTDVRVERLKDISEPDAQAEGIGSLESHIPSTASISSKKSFMELWNIIHGPDAWDNNPWIAAYTFTVRNKNIDDE